MMDDPRDIGASENGDGCENEVHEQLTISESLVPKENINDASSCTMENDGLCANFEDSMKLNDIKEVDSSAPEITEVSPSVAEEPVKSECAGHKSDKPLKVETKAKTAKLRSSKDAAETALMRFKDGKDVSNTSGLSNGTLASEPHPTRPLASRSKSFNRHVAEGSSKTVGSITNANHTKQVGHPVSTSSRESVAQNEKLMEKTKLRVLKKSASSKAAGTTQTSLTDGEEKPRKVGALPSYDFSFRCNERAEKRREFYSKLEEKIQAKESEKSNLQAKSKETQEVEMKMLRKSLKFKATPMPSFYQESAPPKTDLKKIPPTRPKSPKLGRKKGSLPSVSEEGSNARNQPSRLSLDEKLSENNPSKDSAVVNVKKPVRKSLPKLPSQKTNLPNERKRPSDQKTSVSKETRETAHQQNNSSKEPSGAPADAEKLEADVKSNHIQSVHDVEPVVEVQPETTVEAEAEAVAVEH